MKYTFFLIYLFFLTLSSFALNEGNITSKSNGLMSESSTIKPEEIKRKEVWISTEYREGSFLIYDCKGRHFTCVNQEGYSKCINLRKYSYDKRNLNLGCAPLKEYKKAKLCYNALYGMIHSIKSKKFCLNNRIL